MPCNSLKSYQETPLNIYQANSFNYNNPGNSFYHVQKQGVDYSEQKVDYSVM